MEQHSVISSVKQNASDVSSIIVVPGAPVDPTLQKKMDILKTWPAYSEVAEVCFATYLSKSQKKKISKYQTRSQGPPSSSK